MNFQCITLEGLNKRLQKKTSLLGLFFLLLSFDIRQFLILSHILLWHYKTILGGQDKHVYLLDVCIKT